MFNLRVTIAENLMRDREKRKLTHTEYAKRIGISRTTMYLYETGKRYIPTDTLYRIYETYGVTPNEMLGIKAQ